MLFLEDQKVPRPSVSIRSVLDDMVMMRMILTIFWKPRLRPHQICHDVGQSQLHLKAVSKDCGPKPIKFLIKLQSVSTNHLKTLYRNYNLRLSEFILQKNCVLCQLKWFQFGKN